jgi:hypothetical protein
MLAAFERQGTVSTPMHTAETARLRPDARAAIEEARAQRQAWTPDAVAAKGAIPVQALSPIPAREDFQPPTWSVRLTGITDGPGEHTNAPAVELAESGPWKERK